MKKLLAVIIVLAIVSPASAQIMESMKIINNGGYWALISSTSEHPVTGGTIADTCPAILYSLVEADAGESGLFPYNVGLFGVFCSKAEYYSWTAAPGIYMDNFLWSGGPADTLNLYWVSDGISSYGLADSYTVPEPGTILLLSAGAIGLLRASNIMKKTQINTDLHCFYLFPLCPLCSLWLKNLCG